MDFMIWSSPADARCHTPQRDAENRDGYKFALLTDSDAPRTPGWLSNLQRTPEGASRPSALTHADARVGQVPRPVLVNQGVAARFEEKRRLPFW